MSKSKERRTRRKFTTEFKAEVVRMCRAGGQSVREVSVRLSLNEGSVRLWLKQAEVDAAGGTPEALSSVEREELVRLRREHRRLLEEREILKKAAAFFAKESS